MSDDRNQVNSNTERIYDLENLCEELRQRVEILEERLEELTNGK